jgi:predicted house-cleaning noncanonical NTP pyrophosphatase (MazG superfamily)
MQEFNKLVRDRIPEIIERNGDVPEYRPYDAVEFRFALLNKIAEESKEFLEKDEFDTNGLLNEVADCKETYDYICAEWHVGLGVMSIAARRPRIIVSADPRQDLLRIAGRMYDMRHDHDMLVGAAADYRNAFEIAVNHFLLLDKLYERQAFRAKERGRFSKRLCLIRTLSKEEAKRLRAAT